MSDQLIYVFIAQQSFSSYTFPKMKALFGLKADNYNELSTFVGGENETPEEIRNLVIGEFLRLHKTSQHITSANQLQISIQRNPKKWTYDTAGLHEDVCCGLGIVSSSDNSEGKVDVLLNSLSSSPLPINKAILTHDDLVEANQVGVW